MNKTTSKIKLNRVIKPGISMTSKGNYRCRITINNKQHENYLPSLKLATSWLTSIKTKYGR